MRVLVFSLAFGLVFAGPASAQLAREGGALIAGKSFIVPDEDGYGVADCLRRGQGGCGQVVADAYCQSQGFAAAAHFGAVDASEITGSVPRPASARAPKSYLVITCKE